MPAFLFLRVCTRVVLTERCILLSERYERGTKTRVIDGEWTGVKENGRERSMTQMIDSKRMREELRISTLMSIATEWNGTWNMQLSRTCSWSEVSCVTTC